MAFQELPHLPKSDREQRLKWPPSTICLWDSFLVRLAKHQQLAVLIGAAILIFTGIGSWKIMLSVVLGTLSMGFLCNLLPLNAYMTLPAYYHLVMGGFAFGAVFMATDPVTASHTEKGKWIYGFMIGVLVVLIRIFNPAYPEGMMLAILLMNVWSPLIDYFVVEGYIKRRLKRAKVKANA